MAAKQLPIVGEAFLGSDPLVRKVVRITYGSSGYSGTNDVDATTVGAQNLLTFADSGFFIENIAFRTVELFSAATLLLGIDSDPDAIGADTIDSDFTGTTAGALMDCRYGMSTSAGVLVYGSSNWINALGFPADSDDEIQGSMSGSAAMGTEGHLEVFVYYHEIP